MYQIQNQVLELKGQDEKKLKLIKMNIQQVHSLIPLIKNYCPLQLKFEQIEKIFNLKISKEKYMEPQKNWQIEDGVIDTSKWFNQGLQIIQNTDRTISHRFFMDLFLMETLIGGDTFY